MMLDMATNLSILVRDDPDLKDITVDNLLVVVLIVYSYMYMCILVQFIATTHVAFLSSMYIYIYIYSMLYSSTINCILYGRKMRLVQQLITLFASILLLLLLLLIIIYDCVGMYNETIIMNWYVGQ